VLCCAVLCCAVLCCAVLCCAVLCCAVLCCAVLCCAVLCCAALWLAHAMLPHAILSCAVACCAVECSQELNGVSTRAAVSERARSSTAKLLQFISRLLCGSATSHFFYTNDVKVRSATVVNLPVRPDILAPAVRR
jgi:hypothetical protein